VAKGLLQGVASIGINYATQELGLNPLLANIGFSAISTAINAGIQTATGQTDPDTGKPIDYFKSIYDTYTKNALTFLGGSGDAWQQSAYMAQIQDFTKIAQDKGLVSALNTYGTGFFNAIAVNEMTKTGISIGDYLYNKLDELAYVNKTIDGTTYATVDIKDDGTSDILAEALFQQKQKSDGSGFFWDFAGLKDITKDGYTLGYGQLGVDAYGKLGYTDAKIYTTFNSDIQYQQIVNGQQSYAEIKDSTGKTLLVIEPTDGGHYNIYDSYGKYVAAKIKDYTNQPFTISLKDGLNAYEGISFKDTLDGEAISTLKNLGLTDDEINHMSLNVTRDSTGNVSFDVALPNGSHINSISSGLSSVFANFGALFLGIDTQTSKKIPDYIRLPMQGLSLFKFMPSLAVPVYNMDSVFDVFDIGVTEAIQYGGSLKDLIIAGCEFAKSSLRQNIETIKSPESSSEKIVAATKNLYKFGDDMQKAIEKAAGANVDAKNLQRALDIMTDVLGWSLNVIRGSDAYKKSRDEMNVSQRLFSDVVLYNYDHDKFWEKNTVSGAASLYNSGLSLWEDIFKKIGN